jgi:hypothetical protein
MKTGTDVIYVDRMPSFIEFDSETGSKEVDILTVQTPIGCKTYKYVMAAIDFNQSDSY